MDDSLVSTVDRTDVDTSKTLFASIYLTSALYNSTRALPVHMSPTERIVKKKVDDFTGLAKITASYMPISTISISTKPFSINDMINVQNHSYSCASIPVTHFYSRHVSENDLLTIPHSDFVGIKKYIFNPLDENGCKEFDMDFIKDVSSMKYCSPDMANKFSILLIEAFKDQKRLPILSNGPIPTPIPIYLFFIDNKSSITNSDTKVNGSIPGSKSIYILHCNSDTDPDKYTYRNHIRH